RGRALRRPGPEGGDDPRRRRRRHAQDGDHQGRPAGHHRGAEHPFEGPGADHRRHHPAGQDHVDWRASGIGARVMADIRIVWDADAMAGDWLVAGGTLDASRELASAVAVALFTHRTAEPDDPLPHWASDRRGWWAD